MRLQSLTSRPLVLGVALVMAATLACQSTPTFTFTSRTPVAPTPATGATTTPVDGTTVETVECGETTAETMVEPQPYLAEAPERPDVPGAGQGEEEELNEGVDLLTPIDPDAVIESDEGIDEPVIVPPGAQGDPLPEDVVTHRPVTTVPSQVSHIAEPNIAVSRATSLMTWNWGAARSFDGGATINYLDPWRQMQEPDGTAVDGGFCCDQLAQYVPQSDMWLWVLQSQTLHDDYSGGNRIRIAVATGNGTFNRNVDFVSSGAGLAEEVWFDQPKIGVSDEYLFLSVNAYGAITKPFVASLVYRVSLAELAGGGESTPDCFTTAGLPDRFGRPIFAPVPVRIARKTMYLGAHYSNSELTVWRWPDDSARPTVHVALDVTADGRPAGYPLPTRTDADGRTVLDYRCPPGGAYERQTDWCQRSGDRISTAWLANGRIGFAWNVGQDPANGWNYPSVVVRMIDETRLASCAQGGCVVAKPSIRHSDVAYQYAAITPNARGDLGLIVIFGGGQYRPSCQYAIRDADAADDAGWDWSKESISSTRNAFKPEFGDYLNIWPGPNPDSWTAACMTIQTSDPETPGSAHFLTFGRRADQ